MSHIKPVKLSLFILLILHFEKLIKIDHNTPSPSQWEGVVKKGGLVIR